MAEEGVQVVSEGSDVAYTAPYIDYTLLLQDIDAQLVAMRDEQKALLSQQEVLRTQAETEGVVVLDTQQYEGLVAEITFASGVLVLVGVVVCAILGSLFFGKFSEGWKH